MVHDAEKCECVLDEILWHGGKRWCCRGRQLPSTAKPRSQKREALSTYVGTHCCSQTSSML
jgi:hypothetical protein